MGRFSEGGSSGSADGKKYEEAFDWKGNIVLEEAPEVEEPPPLPPPKTLAQPEDPPAPAEAGPFEVAPSAGQDVMQRIAEAPARLGTAAYIALEDEFIRVAKLEDLRPEDRNLYHSCTRVGSCDRCRWMTGCDSCDEEKAWVLPAG